MKTTRWMVAGLWIGLCAACGSSSSPAPASPTPGSSACVASATAVCFGQQNYVEYNGGDLPFVISVPHGGAIEPAGVPDRTGTTVTDLNTIELGRAIVAAFRARSGRAPHIVFCHVRRTKLDANREVVEAAQGHAAMIQAWNEYHAFLELAIGDVRTRSGRGIYIDLHGHGHARQRLELGYLLTAETLDLTDAMLVSGGHGSSSSLRALLTLSPETFPEVLRGPRSLGGLLSAAFPSVPSPTDPSPGADPYFTGGYSTERHTSALAGVQIEANFTGVRDTAASRAAFAETLVTALTTFAARHLGL